MADLKHIPSCTKCSRLVDYLIELRHLNPDYHNHPVESFGDLSAELLIVGLAPGRHGANRTSRPFTGDYAGDLLYDTLSKAGLATGSYSKDGQDDFSLKNCRICNAVRCVPPQNKPTTAEIKTCNPFLQAEIAAMPNLKVIFCLGRVAHEATLVALGQKKSAFAFGHGAVHTLGNLILVDSYHCSRYNTQTKRLTAQMFEDVIEKARTFLSKQRQAA